MTISEVEKEIRSLRAENTRLRYLAGAVLASALGIAAMGQASPVQDLLQVRRLEVVDEQGRARAMLYSDPLVEGNAMLSFRGGQGRVRIDIREGLGGTGALYLFDAKGVVRASLLGSPYGDAHIEFRDGGKHPRIQMGTHTFPSDDLEGSPCFWIQDRKGVAPVNLGMPQDGEPNLTIMNGKKKVLLRVPQ